MPANPANPPRSANPAGPDESRARHQLADRLSLARAQQGRGQLEAALATLDAILAAARDAGLTGSATVLTARRLHAEVHFGLGHPDLAYELAEELYRDCAARLPARHPATLRTAVLLAGIAYLDGDLDTTEQLCRWVLGEPESATTPATGKVPAGRALLLASVHLALVGAARGELRPALAALAPALRVLRERYGGHDPDTLRVSAELADLYHLDGDDGAAQRLLTRAHHDAHGHFGPDHPTTRGLDAQLSRLEPPMPSFDRPAGPDSPARRGSSRRQARSVAEVPKPRRPLFSRKPRAAQPPAATSTHAPVPPPGAAPPRAASLPPDDWRPSSPAPATLPPADWRPSHLSPAALPPTGRAPVDAVPVDKPPIDEAPGEEASVDEEAPVDGELSDQALPQAGDRVPTEVESARQVDHPAPVDSPEGARSRRSVRGPQPVVRSALQARGAQPQHYEPWPPATEQGTEWQEHTRLAAGAGSWAGPEPSPRAERWAEAAPWPDPDTHPHDDARRHEDVQRYGAAQLHGEVQWYPRLDRPALPAGRAPGGPLPGGDEEGGAAEQWEPRVARLDALAPRAERRPPEPELEPEPAERAVWTPATPPPQIPPRRSASARRPAERAEKPRRVRRWPGRVRRRPEPGTAPRTFRVSWTVAVVALVLGLGSVAAAAGVLTAVGPEHHWHAGGSTPAPAPSATTSGATGAAIPGDLTIRAGSGAGDAEIDVGWTDPTGGEATPVLILTDVSGNRVAIVTLAPGTTSYRREHLAPGRDYCVLIALYLSAHDGAAVGRSACTHNFVTS